MNIGPTEILIIAILVIILCLFFLSQKRQNLVTDDFGALQQWHERALQTIAQEEERYHQKYNETYHAKGRFISEALEKGQWVFGRITEDTPISVPVEGMGSVMGCTMAHDFPSYLDTADVRPLNWEYSKPNLTGQIVLQGNDSLMSRTRVWIPFTVTEISGNSYRFQVLDNDPMKFSPEQPDIQLTLIAGNPELGQTVAFEFLIGGETSRRLVDGQKTITYGVQAHTWYYFLSATNRPSGWQRTPDRDWSTGQSDLPARARDLFPVYGLLFVARPVG